MLSLAGLVPLGLLLGFRRRMRTSWFVLLAGIALLIPAISCGSGGGSGGGGGGGSNPYTITVTATIPNETPSKTLGTVNVTVTH